MQLNAQQIVDALPWEALVNQLDLMFTKEVQSPVRHHHFINVPDAPQATLLLMPAWVEGEYLGIKQVNVFPGNSKLNLPGLNSHYLLNCGKTGQPLAQLEGNELTARRTAAASALASRYLSRPESAKLLVMGAGRMARRLIQAHMAVRPITQVWVWGRNPSAAADLVMEFRDQGLDIQVASLEDLPRIASQMDIISCATMATTPILKGEWLSPGCHLDLVGSFTPTMREADDEALRRSQLFVDTRAGALSETGELLIPLQQGVIDADDVLADLPDLCRGAHLGRAALADPENAITLFKSVGASIEDLAAAILAYQRYQDIQG
ncbi:ornithine cyclodeaminase family protein [Oceanisphaera arctica]|uniref:Ornithine cyclodeaminase n=1 Tax=Oceanisphaera arctica TaxID=641510 RepID=A0A2P5TK12_9GAMM|nr:ornithine cyclodeaminase family protein [Oceanisphaera arctica]PPL15437.1 ornithine cyclodeaminase [Oceanisphaera arctica]GHA22387.1 ornithine cyclodeaminase [Oceanisphaera arctica]